MVSGASRSRRVSNARKRTRDHVPTRARAPVNPTGSVLLPFGKHVGQTLDEIASRDPSYLKWIVRQDWFRDKHADLYQAVAAMTK
jgi:hypothetical protein